MFFFVNYLSVGAALALITLVASEGAEMLRHDN